MSNPPAFSLHVFVDRSACHANCLAGRALTRLQRDGVPGVDLRQVDLEDAADVRLRATDLGLQLLMPGAQAALPLLEPSPQAVAESDRVDALADQASSALHRVARTRNLLQLAARRSSTTSPTDLRLTLKLRRRNSTLEVPISAEQLVATAPGDVLLLDGRNEGDDPVDFAAFWLGADQSIRQIYPEDSRDSPRLSAGESLKRIGLVVDAGSKGVERLLIMTMPMRPGQEVSDFRFLEQRSISRVRGVGHADLQALLDACFADYRVRGDNAPALPAEKLGMQLFTFRVAPQ